MGMCGFPDHRLTGEADNGQDWGLSLRPHCHARPDCDLSTFKELDALGFESAADGFNGFMPS